MTSPEFSHPPKLHALENGSTLHSSEIQNQQITYERMIEILELPSTQILGRKIYKGSQYFLLELAGAEQTRYTAEFVEANWTTPTPNDMQSVPWKVYFFDQSQVDYKRHFFPSPPDKERVLADLAQRIAVSFN